MGHRLLVSLNSGLESIQEEREGRSFQGGRDFEVAEGRVVASAHKLTNLYQRIEVSTHESSVGIEGSASERRGNNPKMMN